MAYREDPLFNYANQSFYFDDCYNLSTWDLRQTGSGHSMPAVSAANPGQVFLEVFNSGELANGNFTGVTQTNDSNFIFGGGPFIYTGYFNLSVLGNVTDIFQWSIGMHDGWQFGTTPGNGTYFLYDFAVSPNWQIVSVKGGTSTKITSSVAVTTGWHKIIIDATVSSVTFYMDGVSLGTISTNLPTSNGYNLNGHLLIKTLGTSSVTTLQDYFTFQQNLTTSR